MITDVIVLKPNAMAKRKLNSDAKKVFDAYPKTHRASMLAVRDLILDVAASIECVGELEETLKWGEPSYLTSESKSGTTIRIDWKPKNPDVYGIYVNCQTDLVKRFRREYSDTLQFEGDRAILISVTEPLPIEQLSECIAAALTYHRDKKREK